MGALNLQEMGREVDGRDGRELRTQCGAAGHFGATVPRRQVRAGANAS